MLTKFWISLEFIEQNFIMTKREINPLFPLELLPDDKEAVLDKYRGLEKRLWDYVEAWYRTYHDLLEIEGFYFFHSATFKPDPTNKIHQELAAFARWAVHNVPTDCYTYPLSLNTLCYFRTKSGLWIAVRHLYSGPYWMVDPSQSQGLAFRPIIHNHRLSSKSNAVQVNQETYLAENLYRVDEINRFFHKNWTMVRNQYKRQLFESGEAQKLLEKRERAEKIAQTTARMESAAKAKMLLDELQGFIKSLNDATITAKQISAIYHQMEKLSTANRKLRLSYGKRMKPQKKK